MILFSGQSRSCAHFPAIPLWIGALQAAFAALAALQVYFRSAWMLSLIGWTWLARTSLAAKCCRCARRVVLATQLTGWAADALVIFRHLLPGRSLGHIIRGVDPACPALIRRKQLTSCCGHPPAAGQLHAA